MTELAELDSRHRQRLIDRAARRIAEEIVMARQRHDSTDRLEAHLASLIPSVEWMG